MCSQKRSQFYTIQLHSIPFKFHNFYLINQSLMNWNMQDLSKKFLNFISIIFEGFTYDLFSLVSSEICFFSVNAVLLTLFLFLEVILIDKFFRVSVSPSVDFSCLRVVSFTFQREFQFWKNPQGLSHENKTENIGWGIIFILMQKWCISDVCNKK